MDLNGNNTRKISKNLRKLGLQSIYQLDDSVNSGWGRFYFLIEIQIKFGLNFLFIKNVDAKRKTKNLYLENILYENTQAIVEER